MIEVKCFATLRRYTPSNGKVEHFSGMKVKDLIKILNIPEDEVKIIFVNGVHASLDTELNDGDRVGLFPAIGGG